jgi:hypothetical protein
MKLFNKIKMFLFHAIYRKIDNYEGIALFFLLMSGVIMFLQSYGVAIIPAYISNLFLWFTIIDKDKKK